MSFTTLSKPSHAQLHDGAPSSDSIDDSYPHGFTTRDPFAQSMREDTPFTLTLPPSPKFSDGFHGLLSPPPSAGLKKEAKPAPLVLQSTPKFSNEFHGLLSPPPSAGLKRRSHIRRKERPERLSQSMRVPPPMIITQAPESHNALQLPYARSPPPPPPRNPRRPSTSSYRPPLSAPSVLQHVGTGSKPPESPKSPSSAPVYLPQGSEYRTDPLLASGPPKVPTLVIPISPRHETRGRAEFTLPSSPMSPPLSATIYVQESPDQTEFSVHGSPSSPLSAPIYLRHESLDRADSAMDIPIGPPPAPIYIRQRGHDRPFKFDIPAPDSPGSIYSTLSSEGPRSAQWDTIGGFKAEDSEGSIDFMRKPDPWFMSEGEGVGLARQNTQQIVELLRLRRRRAGLE